MKTMKMKNKEKKIILLVILSLVLVSIVGAILIDKQIAFAQGEVDTTTGGNIEITTEKVHVKIQYVFEDGNIYKVYTKEFDKGYMVQEADLEVLSEDMRFLDDFTGYEVLGTDDLIIRKVELIKKEETPVEPEIQKFQVKIIYMFENGSFFKEYVKEFEKGYILGAKDFELLPRDMEFVDDFVFYQVQGKDDFVIRVVDYVSEKTPQNQQSTNNTNTQADQREMKRLEDEARKLERELFELNYELKDKDKLTKSQEDLIKKLEKELEALKKELTDNFTQKNLDLIEQDQAKDEMKKLNEKITSLESQLKNLSSTQAKTSTQTVIPQYVQQTPMTSVAKPSTSAPVIKNPNGGTVIEQKEEPITRYPNKLSPKNPNGDETNNSNNQATNTNKGVATPPSQARGSVTENVDNGNGAYPIHHTGDGTQRDIYSADARQFITFQTKNGKTFHLIINHDEDSENVMLLTEVSEDDLLNMVEKKETPKQEITKEEPVKEEVKPEKKEEKSDLGTYILLALVVAGALGGGYYFKVVKKKEKEELENLEEDDEFFSEAEEYEESEASEDEE